MKLFLHYCFKRTTYFFLICLLYSSVNAQTFSWARMETGTGLDEGESITTDASGNVYTIGEFEGRADFDPGAGISNLTSSGFTDIFIQKVNASGNLVWAKKVGGTENDYATAVCVDASGNVYISGSFKGTIDLDPGAGVTNVALSGANTGAFILKLNSTGSFVWGKSFGGSTGVVKINDMNLNGSGDIIAVGACISSNDMDPNAGTAIMTATFEDGFILNLSSAGNYVWAKQLKATGPTSSPYSEVDRMDIDPSGNIVITGRLDDTTDFNPGAGVAKFIGDGFNYFVAKYSSTGTYIWAGTVTGVIWSGDIATDAFGNIFVISESTGSVIDFDITAGISNVSPPNGSLCIQKLSPSGNLLWAKNWARVSSSFCMSLCIDASSNLYISSYFSATIDFNPAAAIFNLTPTTALQGYGDDNFILKIDNNGNFITALKYGSNCDDRVNGMYVDLSGNIYSTGSFKGYGNFDPGAGVTNLITNGNTDIFVQKLTNTNALAWVFGIGGKNYQAVKAVSKTMKSYVYATGSFDGSIPVPNTSSSSSSYGGSDIIIDKIVNTGSINQLAHMGGTGDDGGSAIISDSADNVYVAGYFENTAGFLGQTLTSAGSNDIFIVKINSLGKRIWAKQIGGISTEFVNGMTLDKSGNLYLTGFFQGTLDFNPGAAVNNLTSAGNLDAFVLKLDTAGNFIWVRDIGGTADDIGLDITVDGLGNVITTGYFTGTADFNPSLFGTSNLTSVGNIDMFVQKLNASGNFVWAKSIGSISDDYGSQVTVDSVNNLIIAGNYSGVADFDPGVGTFNLTPPNSNFEMFLLQLTPTGNFSWAKSIGGTGVDDVNGLNIDRFGTLYLTGSFEGTADFNPNPAKTFNLTSIGGSDAFILCYNPTKDTIWAKSIGSSGYDDGIGLTVDNAFGVYTIGNFSSTVDFNPNAGTFNLTSLGNPDIYALKLDQPILLPIELTSFTAYCEPNSIHLSWQTASESNNDYFEIDRSVDAINFTTIGEIDSQNGNSSNIQNYYFDDKNLLNDDTYYRLKQVDKNGIFSYSDIVHLKCNIKNEESSSSINIYPNPTVDNLNIFINTPIESDAIINVYDIYASLVLQKQILILKGNNFFDINVSNVAAGTYVLEVVSNNTLVHRNKIIKL